MKWYKDATVLIEDAFVESVAFSVDGNTISKVVLSVDDFDLPEDAISLNGNLVVPGFIDQHIHGSIGFDFMDADADKNLAIAEYLPSLGVTSFLATTLTASPDEIRSALKSLIPLYKSDSSNHSQLLGVHLEGPYINPTKKGAHVEAWIAKPSIDHFKNMVSEYESMIKLVTLAPECDDRHEFVSYLTQCGIVSSVGHSNATFLEVQNAHGHGLKCTTHCYNAMNSITSRDGGVLGATLSIDTIWAELISDGIHVSKENVILYHKSKPDSKKILISDAMRARGMKAGSVMLGELQAYYDGEKVVLEDGTLAGSALEQTNAIQSYMKTTNEPFEHVVKMLTINPAELLGISDRKGRISEGKDADFVVLNKAYEIIMTVCKGTVCYNRSNK